MVITSDMVADMQYKQLDDSEEVGPCPRNAVGKFLGCGEMRPTSRG